ncbi:MAG TPA: UvrD-helicase domain-containing protein [Solirubrobacter sp.]|nr:UvrD-helicase domain-containing protein [Solirubrobacter sp.]
MSAPFDVCGPLPRGVTVLEASAGTGKTYTIAALAARYVAEGTPLPQLLLVTFTRMATGELRDRVRERLVAVEAGLAGVPSDDEIVRLLASGTADEVHKRRENLSRALADFDAATIATTHSFCQDVLGGLGVAGDVEREMTLAEDVDDLLEEVVDDLYVRRFHWDERPQITRAQALQIARAAVENPGARLEPAGAPGESDAAMRVRLAVAARDELDRRKRRAAVITYDDLLTRLDAALKSDDVVRRVRARWRVVLVDEFQDTDPVQWSIMRRAFGAGTLVLIGDPKQAIYAFRGADVYAYLEAARAASSQATLQVNWRSDQGLLEAYDVMFGGARLGHSGIVYRRVEAAAPNRSSRLLGAPVDAPLRVRVLSRDDVVRTSRGFASNGPAREWIARDLAGDLVRLLESGATLARPEGPVRVCPGHVAVLVRTHRNASLVRDALEEVGVPAVINGAGSVFGTDAARDWLRLLEAIERPTSALRAHAAALTPFLGWSAARVAGAGDDEWEEVHRRLHEWARVLRVRGVAALAETISRDQALPRRLLGIVAGERYLTDLRHVGQLLHAAARAEHFGTAALTSWLRRRADPEQDKGDEEDSRRLESDAEAVQVLTIHRSKGLEFPIVYFPYLWEPGFIPRGVPIAYHDPRAGDERVLDVGLGGYGWDDHRRRFVVEQRGEDLRLAYVALTRAQHQAVVWWAGSFDSRDSALGRLLFARADDGTVAPSGTSTPTDDAAIARFEALAGEAPGCISVERSIAGPARRWVSSRAGAEPLSVSEFERELDRGWRRTSYSDITAGAHEARVASEPEEPVVVDEPEPDVFTSWELEPASSPGVASGAPGPAAPETTPPLPLGAIPGGTAFGTFVHTVLEATDFAAPDLDLELTSKVGAAVARRPVEIGSREAVVAGLRTAIETPLGPLVDGLRLRDVARGDRLDELVFELPLAGGDEPVGRLTPGAIGAVLREHLHADDPLAGYADRLDDPELRSSVRGYLTGSIDLVVRTGGAFAVVDYKTNWLGGPGEELTLDHYRPHALAAEMQRAHYGLQALLYTAALHRYLRWRVRSYDPDRHLAGVLYLFVRGMVGTPDAGVFAWRPPAALVVALSDLLDAGAPA